MIAVDTNLLVRIMIVDDVDQARRARSVFDEAVRTADEVVVAPIVFAELVWVLRKTYKLGRAVVVEQLEKLAAAPFLRIPDRDVVLTAITDYRQGGADFADYLIAAYAEREGASPLYSFDADALETRRFTPVP